MKITTPSTSRLSNTVSFLFILGASELWWDFQLFFLLLLLFHTCRNNSKSLSAQQCLAWDLNHLFDVCLLNLYCPHLSLTRWWWGDSNFLQLIIVPATVLSVLDSIITTTKKPPTLSRGEVEIVQIFAAVPVFTFLLYLSMYIYTFPKVYIVLFIVAEPVKCLERQIHNFFSDHRPVVCSESSSTVANGKIRVWFFSLSGHVKKSFTPNTSTQRHVEGKSERYHRASTNVYPYHQAFCRLDCVVRYATVVSWRPAGRRGKIYKEIERSVERVI